MGQRKLMRKYLPYIALLFDPDPAVYNSKNNDVDVRKAAPVINKGIWNKTGKCKVCQDTSEFSRRKKKRKNILDLGIYKILVYLELLNKNI